MPIISDEQSELYHGSKWFNEIPTPMVRQHQGATYFDIFSGEAYYCQDDNEWIVPLTFAQSLDGTILASGKEAKLEQGSLHVYDRDIVKLVKAITSL
ncbi:hypothetical protein HDU77_010914, partial [Chytriomyces hyalinus]